MSTSDTFITQDNETFEPRADDAAAVGNLLNEMFGKAGEEKSGESSKKEAAQAPEHEATPPPDNSLEGKEPAATKEPEATPAPESVKEGEPKVETPAAPKVETPKEPAPVKEEPKAPAAEADPELDAIQQPRGLNPANQQNWTKLRETAKTYKTEAKQLRADMEALKAQNLELQQKTTQMPDPKEVEELRQFRRIFDIKNDPAFTKKYDQEIAKVDGDIVRILQMRGLSKEHIDAMNKHGGPGAYSQDWWNKEVIETLEKSDVAEDKEAARLISAKLNQRIALKWDREQAIVEASDAGSKYVKDQLAKQEFNQKYEAEVIQKRVAEIQKEIPWMRLQEIPAGATPEQKAKIEQQNKDYQLMEHTFVGALYPTSPEQKVATAEAACMAILLNRDLEATKAQLQSALAEIEKFKNVGKTANAGRAAVTTPVKAPPVSLLKMSDEDAFNHQWNQMKAGK